jgi:hypothetical protein
VRSPAKYKIAREDGVVEDRDVDTIELAALWALYTASSMEK